MYKLTFLCVMTLWCCAVHQTTVHVGTMSMHADVDYYAPGWICQHCWWIRTCLYFTGK